MPTVELRIGPLPAHVRTARLIAAVVARRCLDDGLIDEVKLAVGEACSRAVSLHAQHAPSEQVVVEMVEGTEEFAVTVLDHGPPDGLDGLSADAAASLVESALRADAGTEEPLPAHLGLALITGLVDQLTVERDGHRTAVQMRWRRAEPA